MAETVNYDYYSVRVDHRLDDNSSYDFASFLKVCDSKREAWELAKKAMKLSPSTIVTIRIVGWDADPDPDAHDNVVFLWTSTLPWQW